MSLENEFMYDDDNNSSSVSRAGSVKNFVQPQSPQRLAAPAEDEATSWSGTLFTLMGHSFDIGRYVLRGEVREQDIHERRAAVHPLVGAILDSRV